MTESRRGWKGWLRLAASWLGPVLGVTLIIAAIIVLRRQLEGYSYDDVVAQLLSTPLPSVLLALLLAAGAYTALVGYDAIALHYCGRTLPLRRIALGSFVAYSMSHSLGFHMITSGSIRYRFWSSWGLSNAEIARALGFASTSFLMGMLLVSGFVLLFEPPDTMALLRLPTAPLRVIGGALVTGVVCFLLWMRFSRGELKIMRTRLPMPKVHLALGHLMIAAADWVMAAGVAYVLLPAGHEVGLFQFIGVFLFALLVGAIGHVPGGVGVFETLVVIMLKPWLDPPVVLGSMILYRLIYYVLPFVIGLTLMIAHEATRQRTKVASAAGWAARWVPAVMPIALSVVVFSTGTILLLSSAVKMNVNRMEAMFSAVPLLVIELSHFSAGLLGASLLLLAGFLQQRLRMAYRYSAMAMLAAVMLSVLRGLVWEVAVLLLLAFCALVLSRGIFTREGSVATHRLPAAWVTGIIIVLVLTIWLGFFSFNAVDYSAHLWLEFSLESDVSRFMRAMAGVLLFVLTAGMLRRFHGRTDREGDSGGG